LGCATEGIFIYFYTNLQIYMTVLNLSKLHTNRRGKRLVAAAVRHGGYLGTAVAHNDWWASTTDRPNRRGHVGWAHFSKILNYNKSSRKVKKGN
jgi:hypothetical protein